MKFHYFNENRKQSIESLEFFYLLHDFYIYLLKKKETTNSTNSVLNEFIDAIKSYYRWQFYRIRDYADSLKDYVFWQYREFYLDEMQKFVSHKLTGREFVDHFYFALEAFDDEPESRDLSENQLRQIVNTFLPRVKKYFLEE